MDVKVEEDALLSQQKMNEYKEREFREYLVQKEVVLAMVKFLLSIRNSKEKPDSPSQALMDYFGAYKDESWKEYETMEEQVNILREENNALEEQQNALIGKIQEIKEEQARKEEEERQRELEALQKKDSKKGKK